MVFLDNIFYLSVELNILHSYIKAELGANEAKMVAVFWVLACFIYGTLEHFCQLSRKDFIYSNFGTLALIFGTFMQKSSDVTLAASKIRLRDEINLQEICQL